MFCVDFHISVFETSALETTKKYLAVLLWGLNLSHCRDSIFLKIEIKEFSGAVSHH
jgi:hypothetical protein